MAGKKAKRPLPAKGWPRPAAATRVRRMACTTALAFLAWSMIFATLAPGARAQAVQEVRYTDWSRMPPLQRAGFVMGVFDYMSGVVLADDPYLDANSKGLANCRVGLDIDAPMLIKMIDVHYNNHLKARAQLTTVAVLHVALMEVCRNFINENRRQANLDEFP